MPLLSFQDQVSYLLQREVVLDKTQGTPSVEIQAAAVIETLALNFYLLPRTSLYFFHLARNGLSSAIDDALSVLDDVAQDVSDLGNVSYAIRDTSALSRASAALSQVEQQGRLNTDTGSFKNFDASVMEFLRSQLSKNVKRPGAADMVRPGAEAAAALPSDFSSLKALYADLLDRLYALVVGIRNFQNSLSNSLLGLTTANRARDDLDAIRQELQNDSTAASSRDYVVRLLAARQALLLVGAVPDVRSAKLDTAARIPFGYSLCGRTGPMPTAFQSAPGPFTLSPSQSATVTCKGVTKTCLFPIETADVSGAAVLVGQTVSWPVTIPSAFNLLFDVGGTTHRLPLNPTLSPAALSMADVITLINATGYASAVAFDSNRLAIYASSSFSLVSFLYETVVGSTSGMSAFFSNSAASLLGFGFDSADPGVFSASLIADALTRSFATTGLTASLNADGSLSLTMDDASAPPGSVSTASIGVPLTTISSRQTDVVELYPLAGGVGPDSLLASDFVDPGDTLTLGQVDVPIVGTDGASFQLDHLVAQFDGDIVVESAIVTMWLRLQNGLDGFLFTWLRSDFSKNLDTLDQALAPLSGSPTEARRAVALGVIAKLATLLGNLKTLLGAYPLPLGSAREERQVAESILQTLTERKYDRAIDFLLRCRIKEVFELDWQTVSFGGELMAAASSFAQTDIRWPDRSHDEGYDPIATEELGP